MYRWRSMIAARDFSRSPSCGRSRLRGPSRSRAVLVAAAV
ncbi:hypothetical protein LINPERPRIM_LOCUS22509 [Linum perenne]